MPAARFLYLSQEDVIRCGGLEMLDTIATVERVFELYGKGQCVQPLKSFLGLEGAPEAIDDASRRAIAMPAFVGGEFNVVGVKWIPSFPENPRKHGLPRANAFIILNDAETGLPLALMDGTIISAMRTGAATAVAAKYLALPDSKVLGIVGAGVQARTQLLALLRVLREIRQVRVYDLDGDKARDFARDAQLGYGLETVATSSAESAVTDADVVVSVTTAREPHIDANWLKAGAFYAEISSRDAKPNVYLELDRVIVDHWETIRHMKVIPISSPRIHAELWEVIIGAKAGRVSATDRVVFRPIGIGIEDVGEVFRIYKRACAEGVGKVLTLWEEPCWV